MQIDSLQKVHVVTSGGSGIGAATAASLVAQVGHAVTVLDRAKPTQPIAGATFDQAEVADEEAVVAAFARIRQERGRLDGLVTSAGIESTLVWGMEAAAWKWVLNVNVTGTMLCTREAAALMRGHGGAVVNVVSIAGDRACDGPWCTAFRCGLLHGLRDWQGEPLRNDEAGLGGTCLHL